MASCRDHTGVTGPLPARQSWRRGTAAGAIVTGVALGLRRAVQEPEEERRVVVDVSGQEPGPPQALELHFDPAGPGQTWVVLRPHLLPRRR